MLQGVDSLQNRRPVLHILLQGQQVDGQERHACLRKEKMHSPEPHHRSAKQRDASPGAAFGGGIAGGSACCQLLEKALGWTERAWCRLPRDCLEGGRGRPERGLTSCVMVCLQLFAIF